MTLQMLKDYKDIPAYRLSFNELAGEIFGIDFERWYQLEICTPGSVGVWRQLGDSFYPESVAINRHRLPD